jgi:pilus assembly protein CpaD
MAVKDSSKMSFAASVRPTTARLAAVSVIALLVTACRLGDEPGAHVAGWTAIDARQRHPIIVSEQPANLSVRIARGSTGLTPQQRAQVADFINRYSARDAGNGRIMVAAPSGSANEVAAMHAVADLRHIVRDFGISDANLSIQPYRAGGDAPLRIGYARFVAEAPECGGDWSTNLADDARNVPYPNLGCASQRNLAAQISNPADLLGPRTMQPGATERRDVVWDKFVKGDSTVAKKDAEEKVQVKNAQ